MKVQRGINHDDSWQVSLAIAAPYIYFTSAVDVPCNQKFMRSLEICVD